MIRAPENIFVDVSGKAVCLSRLPWWFTLVFDDTGLLWQRDPRTSEWWGSEP